MNQYIVEHVIRTLAVCAPAEELNMASFTIDGVEFSQWDFNLRDGWLGDKWIAKMEVEADNFLSAINKLAQKLSKIVPRIALISQSYSEYLLEPFMVYKIGSDVAFLRYTLDVLGCGLMFMKNEKKALDKLIQSKDIPDTFYYYWNDAVNATGYSAKLLMVFSALEALAKTRNKKIFRKPADLYSYILGHKLAEEIFCDGNGLRNRLVHGEYFREEDNSQNYLEIVHKKMMSYFNEKVFGEFLISENVVSPHRHYFGNKEYGNFFIKAKNGGVFQLREVIKDFKNGWADNLEKYEQVSSMKIDQY